MLQHHPSFSFSTLRKKGKSAEGSERKETNTMKMRGSKDAKARFQKGGMVEKRVGSSERKGRAQREARGKRQTRFHP